MIDSTTAPKNQVPATGSFFAIDRDAWSTACDLGIAPAVSYLVMARGSGGDHRTTSWSVHAIETYTGIGRDRAKKAIEGLMDSGLIELEKAGSKPRYSIVPAYGIPGCRAFDEDKAISRLFGDKVEPLKNWIWLPNTLVDGPEDPLRPLEMVRKTGQVEILRTFIDLYAEQTFTAEGGLPWREGGMRQPYRRIRVGKGDGRIVWGFKPDGVVVDQGEMQARYGAGFKQAVDALVRLGLIDFVPHLVEHDGLDAEIHHSVAGRDVGDGPDEWRLSNYLLMLADAILPADRIAATEAEGITRIVPLQDFMTRMQMVGIPRLRHRPDTKMQVEWRAKNFPIWTRYGDSYNEAIQNLQHQGSDQGSHQGSDQGPYEGVVVGVPSTRDPVTELEDQPF